MATYSFLDVSANINGPGGSINLGAGAAVAGEGITIEATTDKNIMTIGAAGDAMHSLVADASGMITVRLLKTSPVNAQLQTMYNTQAVGSSVWGRNTVTVRNPATGDVITCEQVAFAKQASLTYAIEGGANEWTFHAGKINTVLGVGTPEIG